MDGLKKVKQFGILAIILAVLAVTSDRLYFSDLEWKYRVSRFKHELELREEKSNVLMNEIEARLANSGLRGTSVLLREGISRSATKDNILLLVYSKGKIAYWSDNNVSFPPVFSDSITTKKIIFISNEWFIPICRKSLDYDIVSLIGIGNSYSIGNDLLKSGFLNAYSLPESTGMSFDEKSSPFHITTHDGKFNFAILFSDPKPNTFFIIFPVFFWLGFFIALLVFINSTAGWLSVRGRPYLALMVTFCTVILIYAILIVSNVPPSIQSTKLFSPFIFSIGKIIPSIGYLFILSILLLDFAYVYFKYTPDLKITEQEGYGYVLLAAALLIIALLVFILINYVFKKLVIDSSANFEAYKILDVNLVSVVGIVSVLFLLIIPAIIILKAYKMMSLLPVGTVLLLLIIASTVFILVNFTGISTGVVGIIFIFSTALVLLMWERTSITLFSLLALFSILAGIYTTSIIIKFSDHREDENMKVFAVSIANDNDLIAESLLLDLWPAMEADTTLRKMMSKEVFSKIDEINIQKYLEQHYFIGYWENYDVQPVVCFDDSQLQLPLQSTYAQNCFFFFDDKIRATGDPITGTGFWFINNNLGRAYYLTRLYYYVSPFLTTGLFIELISHIETYQAGYPELLIDASTQRYPKLKGISYAKYSGNNLLLRSGDYQYENILQPVDFKGGEYQIVRKDGYKHLFYNRGDMTVVISKQEVTALDRIITFAYLFIVTMVLTFIVIAIVRGKRLNIFHFDTFRRKLQLAFSSVLIIAFTIVIAAAMLLSITKFTENHQSLISEKIKSVSLELQFEMVLENAQAAGLKTLEYSSLNDILVKLSNVFLSDINLYDPSGELMATSRPELFLKQLEGTRMNTEAYSELLLNKRMEYIREENIGNLKYLSAYMPLYSGNQLIAYLNLPYFKMQDLLAGEISTLVVSVINFTFLFMMLMMWLAVFISERLTSPLSLLQKAMGSVELGKKSEHLHYRSKDEVGEMVKQYNRMIDELDESAKKLARSERELAWREMARQIAHEIKNPLTPMKLNVQQLLRWWKDEVPDFNKRLETFTENQIEYIDNLSSIATAFSNFARLPGADPAEVDVLGQLRQSIELFSQTEGINITLNSGNLSKVVMMADKEHLNGIFSNLIKNAIQAIPIGKFGVIKISLTASFDKVLIVFKDNGIGIPEELKSKLFTPNFTTKSSGMGLGLSIVKRYVETAGGTIWFESSPDKGSTFYLELPILYTVEKLSDSGK